MFYYTMYHQIIKSSFQIREAIPFDQQQEVDITIEEAAPPQFILDDIEKGYFDGITEHYMWFYVNGGYLYYIKDGNYILTNNMGNTCDEKARNCFLTGLAMAICLTQKGYVPLHGAVLEKDDHAIVICGSCGSGKSTTSIELMQRGYQFMADDIAVIDAEEEVVFPGFPMQRLCRDVVNRFQMDYNDLTYLGEEKDKFGYMLAEDQYVNEAKPLVTIFQLRLGEEFGIKRVCGIDKIQSLMHNTYCYFFIEKCKMSKETMKKYFALAEKVEIYEITRPQKKESINDIMDGINSILLQCC